MDSLEDDHIHILKNAEDNSGSKSEKVGDDDELEGSDRRKRKSSKLKNPNNEENVEILDGSGQKKSSTDRNDTRNRSNGCSKAGSDDDDDDYDMRNGLRSRQVKRKQEGTTLEKLSSWYQDGELESKCDGRNKSGSRGHGRTSPNEKQKCTSKISSDRDKSQSRSKIKEEMIHDRKDEKTVARDGKHSEGRESSREKVHGASELSRNPRRRWDESDDRADVRNEKPSVQKHEDDKEGNMSSRIEYSKSKNKGLETSDDRVPKFNNRGDRRADTERKTSRRSVSLVEDNKSSPLSGREVEHFKRSRSPERSGRRHQEPDKSEMESERISNFQRKEHERNCHKEGRSKGRDESEKNRDDLKRRQPPNINDKETADRDIVHDHGRDWEFQRVSRKDGRTEAVKTSSNYVSNENYDVIEIQTKPQETEETQQSESDAKAGHNDEGSTHLFDEATRSEVYISGPSGNDSKDDNCPPIREQNSWRDDNGFQGGKVREQKKPVLGSQPPLYGNQDQGSFNTGTSQGAKGGCRIGGRGGRGWPFGLPRAMQQPCNPNMSPAPTPPNVYLPPFSQPVVWAGPVPPGPAGPRFMGNPQNSAIYFNQPGTGRGMPPHLSVPNPTLNTMASAGRGQFNFPSRISGPPGKAPSRGEQNDYSQNFVDTGMRPQNFIRELELTNVVEDYPKLRELIQKKDEIVAKSASAPMYYKCDLREHALDPEFFGTKFDVILVDPPWEEYVHRAPGVADHAEYWTFEEILNLKIEAIADTPSFIFLWVGDAVGLEQGRQCLKKWGFRRCEDICWVKTNKTNATPGLRHDSHTLFQHSKEHCLMGIKGTVRRSTDGHIIHANIDTDVIIAEEPPYGSTAKPDDMYRIVEHFSLGRRRLELFGADHNIRSGWLTLGKGLTSSNFNCEAYLRNFGDKDGKVWQGGGGRNPPPDTPHLVVTTPDIESLRPKSPMKNQQQMQQMASLIPSATKRPPSLQQNPTSSMPLPWAAPPALEAYNVPMPTVGGDYADFESQRAMSLF